MKVEIVNTGKGQPSNFLVSLLLEISPPTNTLWDKLTAESAFETAVHSPLDRQDVQTLWTEYLFYQRSKASQDKNSIDELINRCLMSVSTSSSLPHSSSAVWQDYRFHNRVSCFFNCSFEPTFVFQLTSEIKKRF